MSATPNHVPLQSREFGRPPPAPTEEDLPEEATEQATAMGYKEYSQRLLREMRKTVSPLPELRIVPGESQMQPPKKQNGTGVLAPIRSHATNITELRNEFAELGTEEFKAELTRLLGFTAENLTKLAVV